MLIFCNIHQNETMDESFQDYFEAKSREATLKILNLIASDLLSDILSEGNKYYLEIVTNL